MRWRRDTVAGKLARGRWMLASTIFSWQPAPGFLGRHRLVFSNGRERIQLRVVVVP